MTIEALREPRGQAGVQVVQCRPEDNFWHRMKRMLYKQKMNNPGQLRTADQFFIWLANLQ
jgi:hypothetical protein